jgi:hypothetical protein
VRKRYLGETFKLERYNLDWFFNIIFTFLIKV